MCIINKILQNREKVLKFKDFCGIVCIVGKKMLDFLKKIAQFVVYIIAKHKMLFSTKRSRFRHEGVKNCRLRFP